MAPRRLYCRSCHVQLRAIPTAVSYLVLILMVAVTVLNIVALKGDLVSLNTLLVLDVVVFLVLASCDIRWGIRSAYTMRSKNHINHPREP